jgi:sigma-B regulation protein RsbU (phosphoserine phosphatase)
MSSAGHPPPLLIRDGEVAPLPAVNGLFLLWDVWSTPPIVEERLQPGDRVVFYTDGITDRCGPADTRFETTRLMEVLGRSSRLDLATMLNALNHELDAFAGSAEPEDDQTMLAIEVH